MAITAPMISRYSTTGRSNCRGLRGSGGTLVDPGGRGRGLVALVFVELGLVVEGCDQHRDGRHEEQGQQQRGQDAVAKGGPIIVAGKGQQPWR